MSDQGAGVTVVVGTAVVVGAGAPVTSGVTTTLPSIGAPSTPTTGAWPSTGGATGTTGAGTPGTGSPATNGATVVGKTVVGVGDAEAEDGEPQSPGGQKREREGDNLRRDVRQRTPFGPAR